jgi:hypothetical protein
MKTTNYALQRLKLGGVHVKTRYDRLANSAGYNEGDDVWLYRPTRTKGKSPKLQSPWEGPSRVVTRINDVVYRIQQNRRSRIMVVHLDLIGEPLRPSGLEERAAGAVGE